MAVESVEKSRPFGHHVHLVQLPGSTVDGRNRAPPEILPGFFFRRLEKHALCQTIFI